MRGHIRKRSKDTWAIVVELPRDPVTGKRRQKWVTVKGTKREAERVLADLASTIQSGSFGLAPARLTLGQFLAKWFEAMRNTVRPQTLIAREQAVKHWTAILGDVPLVKLTPLDVQCALERLPEHLSARSRETYFAILKGALNQAVKWGFLARNPAQGVKPPRGRLDDVHVWDENQVAAFLQVARHCRYYALMYVALATGMRLGELLGLTWDDVDLDRGWIEIRRSVATSKQSGAPVWQEPKTPSSRRRIPIGKDVVDLLRQHRRKQAKERLQAGPAWSDYNLVFCSRRGGVLSKANIHRAMVGICQRAGIPHIRFHDLRHTHATLLLRHGVNSKIVAERLGHSSVKITLDTYSHVLPDTQAQAAQVIEQTLRSATVRLQMVCKRSLPNQAGAENP